MACNFLSAHDDAIKRFRILEGMKYTTGFSGGARTASRQVKARPGFAGMILQGAGFSPSIDMSAIDKYPHLTIYMIVGKDDGNKSEIENLSKNLPREIPFKSELFDGGHVWAPSENMDHAFDWLEQQMRTSSMLGKNKQADIKILKRLMKKNNQIDINILKKLLDMVFDLESDFEKYETMTALEPLVKIHKLDQVPELSEISAR